jgi:hypothetical protein
MMDLGRCTGRVRYVDLKGGIDARCEDLMGELRLNGVIALVTNALKS